MQLLKGIHAIDLALLIGDTLIISDVHIGFEEALNKQGMMVPRDHFPQLIRRMESIFARLQRLPTTGKTKKTKGSKQQKLRQIIINGDLKHEFGTISEQEWRHTLRFLDFLGKHCGKIVLIKGNHDTILGPIAKKRDIEVHDSFFIE